MAGKLILDAIQSDTNSFSMNVGGVIIATSNSTIQVYNVPIVFPSYTVATLPSASPAGQMIYVSDESGGEVMAFSNNTHWLRVTDRATVS